MKKVLFLALIAVLALVQQGCKKEESNEYPFVIQVVREDGRAGANVQVSATADVPNAIPDFLGTTDDEGRIRFVYNNKAVLKIQATRGNPIQWIGCGFVRLIQGQEVNKVIIIQPFDPNLGGC